MDQPRSETVFNRTEITLQLLAVNLFNVLQVLYSIDKSYRIGNMLYLK